MKETKFRNTEIGRIPEDWEIGYFVDVLCTFSAGATPYRGIPDYYNGKINWISSGELNYNVIYDTIEHISEEALRNTNLCLHAPGTFLMAITGLEATGTRGKCAFVGVPSATNQSCLAINGTNKMDIKYLYWYYRMYGDYLAFKYSQGTKQQSFTATIVKNLPITYPKQVIEQRRIASALTSIDNLISSLGKLIEKKKNIKQGAMRQLLTGKTRLKGFNEPWVYRKISEVAMTSSGGTPSRSIISYYYGDINWFTTTELKDNYLYNSVEHITREALSNSSAKMFSANTILMAMYGATIGKLGILKEPSATNQACCAIKCNDIDEIFLFYILLYNRKSIIEKGCGAGQPNISQTIVNELSFLVPPCKKEQQAIATILTKMDDEITALEAKKTKYEAIKQGMMQQLLTGKIRLIS